MAININVTSFSSIQYLKNSEYWSHNYCSTLMKVRTHQAEATCLKPYRELFFILCNIVLDNQQCNSNSLLHFFSNQAKSWQNRIPHPTPETFKIQGLAFIYNEINDLLSNLMFRLALKSFLIYVLVLLLSEKRSEPMCKQSDFKESIYFVSILGLALQMGTKY